MPRPAYEGPSELARAVSRAFRREIGDRRISGRAFARSLGKSEKYTRDRLNDVYEFGLDDIAAFCELIGSTPQNFFAALQREATSANVTPLRQPDRAAQPAAAFDRPEYQREQEGEQENP